MALRWIEGFEGFGSLSGVALDTEMEKKYTEVLMTSVCTLVTGRGGGSALNIGNNQSFYFSKTLDEQPTWIIGFAFRTPAAFSGTNRVMVQIRDGGPAGTLQMALWSKSDGLMVSRGSTELENNTGLFSTNTWYYIEFKTTINAAGSYYVNVGEVEVMSDTGVDTMESANAYADNISFYNTEGTPYYDDIYILDATGSLNNDFLGEMKVLLLLPESDTASIDWTPSAGTDNYALVDENPSNEDTDYIETDTATNTDLYNYEDLTGVDQTVYGIQINTQARVTDASAKDLQNVAYSVTTLSPSATLSVTDTSFKTFSSIEETDPATGALWLAAAVNAAQFGVKMV